LGYTDEQLIKLALEQAPQYREARALTRSASSALTGAKAATCRHQPDGWFHRVRQPVPAQRPGVGSVSLIVTWPLWDRGQREIAVQQAKTNLNVGARRERRPRARRVA
jgi:outer membrane protein TolC